MRNAADFLIKDALRIIKEQREYNAAKARQEKAAYYSAKNRNTLMRDKALNDIDQLRKTIGTDTKTSNIQIVENGKVVEQKTVTETEMSGLRKMVDDGKVSNSALEKGADFVGKIFGVHKDESIQSFQTTSTNDKRKR